jgi:CubicO group peptidase (beta-lactamase class C family)
MTASGLRGSPAHGVWSTVHDVVRFAIEMIASSLVSADTASTATSPVFPGLRGVVPGVGSYPDCVWGLGIEIKGAKEPHWTGSRNSPSAFGHFGGAGTLVWVDLGAVHERAVACVALTDRPFDEWAAEALQLWPALSDAVIDEQLAAGRGDVPEGR